MTHDFIVNTDDLNEYGYRVLSAGIDYTQYMRNPVVMFFHERFNEKHRGSEVIGRCVKLILQDDKLIATIEFDMADEFASKIAGKVERGFLRMASIYADPKATSTEPADVLPGQIYETVTKCKLVELSIVDIGGNDEALKLSAKMPIKLEKLKLLDMSNLKTVALALELDSEASEAVVLKKISDLKLAKEAAEQRISSIEEAQASDLLNKAIALGLIPEALKPTQLAAFKSDFEGQKAILLSLVSGKEAEPNTASANQRVVKEIILGGAGAGQAPDPSKDSFDYLQLHDPVQLRKIREEDPTRYAKLAKEYQSGVRYTPKN